MSYLFIFEDGSILMSKSYCDGYLSACDNGLLDIIDITNPLSPSRYIDGEWVTVEKITVEN